MFQASKGAINQYRTWPKIKELHPQSFVKILDIKMLEAGFNTQGRQVGYDIDWQYLEYSIKQNEEQKTIKILYSNIGFESLDPIIDQVQLFMSRLEEQVLFATQDTIDSYRREKGDYGSIDTTLWDFWETILNKVHSQYTRAPQWMKLTIQSAESGITIMLMENNTQKAKKIIPYARFGFKITQ